MDGLKHNSEIIVIGATNRLDAIDPALRRPGRFDRELFFPLPCYSARKDILSVFHKTQFLVFELFYFLSKFEMLFHEKLWFRFMWKVGNKNRRRNSWLTLQLRLWATVGAICKHFAPRRWCVAFDDFIPKFTLQKQSLIFVIKILRFVNFITNFIFHFFLFLLSSCYLNVFIFEKWRWKGKTS